MAKEIKFHEDARRALEAGVNTLADAVNHAYASVTVPLALDALNTLRTARPTVGLRIVALTVPKLPAVTESMVNPAAFQLSCAAIDDTATRIALG